MPDEPSAAAVPSDATDEATDRPTSPALTRVLFGARAATTWVTVEDRTAIQTPRSTNDTGPHSRTGWVTSYHVQPSAFTAALVNATIVPAAVSYDGATRTALLNPASDLAPATLYTVELTSGIRDLAAQPNALAPLVWSFTTTEDPAAPVTASGSRSPAPCTKPCAWIAA